MAGLSCSIKWISDQSIVSSKPFQVISNIPEAFGTIVIPIKNVE
jgi:hypothetical protein